MPVARQKINAPGFQKAQLPKVQPQNYQGVVTGESNFPITSLIAYVQGAPWTVDYYNQLLGQDTNLKDFDPGADHVHQQYTLIKEVEIRVNSPLSESYTSDTGIMKVTGSGTLPMSIIPNIGDVFTAQVNGGDYAIFRLTNVERKSFNKQSTYYIEYEISTLVSTHPEWFDTIQQRVQRTYHFHKDRLVDGLDALVIPEQHEQIIKTKEFLTKVTQQYFNLFYSQTYSTLILPYQKTTIYDPMLVRFILKICGSFEASQIHYTHNLSIQNDHILSQPTIWDVLLNCDLALFETCNRKVASIPCQTYFRDPTGGSARYQRMDHIVYPFDPDRSICLERELPHPTPTALDLKTTTSHHGITSIGYNQYVMENTTIPLLPDLFVDKYYVLSPNFYEDITPMSLLETMVKRYLHGETLDINKLFVLCERWQKWTRMEQFYLTPVLMLLLRSALGGVSV